ncbi:hypothetical protein [Paenibacillus sp. JDR-2]|uniref:hypothetical protein n=1 Tax=Paenibacillus sp. (strain JDR-2) TaxID=324057 RepID=UPI00123737A5|nr:hypothetical protein [Paenibacillus sp. JDR-2]
MGTLREAVGTAIPRGGRVAQVGEFDMTASRLAEFRAAMEGYEASDGYPMVCQRRLSRTSYEARNIGRRPSSWTS